jgi:FkbM family methyltransferase
MGSQRQSFSTTVALKVAVLTCIAFVLGRYTQEGRGVVKEKLWSAPRPESNEEEALPVSLLDLPSSTKEIVINVGSNLDPIMPAYTMGPCAHSIAVEPIVGCQIMEHRQLSVIHAAVSGRPGVAYMTKNNFDGQSSSLAKVAREDFWNTDKERGDGKRIIVPVITLTSLLHAIPSTVKVSVLKTDMQGFDFTAIRAAGSALKDKVSHIINEVWLNDVYSYDVENDLCRDWLPFMTGLGYTLTTVDAWGGDADTINTRCEKQLKDHPSRPTVKEKPGLDEANAFWIRHDAIDIAFPILRDVRNFNQSYFSEEEYETCT